MKRKILGLALALAVTGVFAVLGVNPQATQARADTPAGYVAFIGADSLTQRLYVLDLASGQVGAINAPIAEDAAEGARASYAWQPGGEALAFVTADGGYGVLTDPAGCFSGSGVCADVELTPPSGEPVLHVAWASDGAWLFLVRADGVTLVPPVSSSFSITLNMAAMCEDGFAVAGEYALCAAPAATGSQVTLLQITGATGSDVEFTEVKDVGTYSSLTTLAVDETGRVALGTSESIGESGWVNDVTGAPQRIAATQIHLYTVSFTSDALLVVGAVADSTGDGSLTDGDNAELFVYDWATGALDQVMGYSGSFAAATDPTSTDAVVLMGERDFVFYTPGSPAGAPLIVTYPLGVTSAQRPVWHYAAGSLPPVPAATTAPLATASPPATVAPLPTFTPFPTIVPAVATLAPTLPSPAGTGCQFAYSGGGGLPVAIGGQAEVTVLGAGLRLRGGSGLGYGLLRELPTGTRMDVLNGPLCADGYRWWQVRLADGTVGWVADSNTSGWWIQTPTGPAPDTTVIEFYANSYSVPSPGDCVTLTWHVENIDRVYYLGDGVIEQPVIGTGTKNECPTSTTTYVLKVHKTDGTVVTPEVTITVGAVSGQPDLYVSEFSLNPASPLEEQPVQVRVGVYNQGTAATGGGFRVEWYGGENFASPGCTWDVSALPAHGGQILTCTYSGYTSNYPSINTKVVVDSNSQITESNEGNNTYLKNITVIDTDSGGAQPDLYVSEFSLNPPSPLEEHPVQVRVGVYNQGTASTGGGFRVEWYGGENFASPGCTWNVGALPAHGGQILTCTYSGYTSHYPSINTKVVVDSNSQITESNEGNNTYLKNITVINTD